MPSLAVAPPMTVPMAAVNASQNNIMTHKPRADTSGKLKNTGAATVVEKAHGQIRRGSGRFAITAPVSIANATRALNGRIRIDEMSTSHATV